MKKGALFAMLIFIGGTMYWHYENHRNDVVTASPDTVTTYSTPAPILKEVVVKDYGVVQLLTEQPFVVDLHDGNGRFRPEILLTQSGVGMRMHYLALDINDQPISQGIISDDDYLDLGSPMGKKVWKILLTKMDLPVSITCKLHGLRS